MDLMAWLSGTWAPGTWASGTWQESIISTSTTTDPGEIWDKNRKRLIKAMRRRDRLIQDEAEIEFLIANGYL